MASIRAEHPRAVFEAFNEGGFEQAAVLLSPDVVWHTFPEWPGPEMYEGVAGVGQLAAEWTENFDEYSWEIAEVYEQGDAVVLLAHHGGTSRVGGTPVRDEVGGVFTDFDQRGRAREAWFYTSWEETRKAAEER